MQITERNIHLVLRNSKAPLKLTLHAPYTYEQLKHYEL
jgi:hypothetical protein